MKTDRGQKMSSWESHAALARAADGRRAHELLELLDPALPASFVQLVLKSLLRVSDHPEVVPRILQHIETDRRKLVRAEAAHVLGKLRDPRAVSTLENFASCAGPGLRGTYREAIRKIGGPDAAQALGRLFDATPSLKVRMLTIEDLARSGEPEAVKVLCERRHAAHSVTRAEIAKALGQLGTDAAVEVLGEMAEDEHPRVRNVAMKALGRAGTPEAIEKLKELRETTRSRYARWRITRRIEAIAGRV